MEKNTQNSSPLGFLNIYKPKGMTSHDVVSKLRRITRIKQIGHTGTLDPFAVGVLPVCIGKCTRLIEYLNDDKAYIATVQFGKNTTTYDTEGEFTETFDKKINENEIIEALKLFEGEVSQTPPIYSAIKVNGKKLYDYARAGQEIEIQPRKIFISKIELLKFNHKTQIAKILIECSKGTYIRSIAFDLGKQLNCGGYLTELERIKAGRFDLKTAINLEDIKEMSDVTNAVINPLNMLDLPNIELSEEEKEKVSHGMHIQNKNFTDKDIVILSYSGRIYAIGMVNDKKILIKKVLDL